MISPIPGDSTLGFLSIGKSGPSRGPQKCLFPLFEGLIMTRTLILRDLGTLFYDFSKNFGIYEHLESIHWASNSLWMLIIWALEEHCLNLHWKLIVWAFNEHWLSIQGIEHSSEEHRTRIWRAFNKNTHLKSIERASEEHLTPTRIWRALNTHLKSIEHASVEHQRCIWRASKTHLKSIKDASDEHQKRIL